MQCFDFLALLFVEVQYEYVGQSIGNDDARHWTARSTAGMFVLPDDLAAGGHFKQNPSRAGADEGVAVRQPLSTGNQCREEVGVFLAAIAPLGLKGLESDLLFLFVTA